MIDTIQRIAEHGEGPGSQEPSYIYTMAQLYRDKLDDQDRAVELFNEALDLNPSFLEAFERINKILTAQKDWKQLERAFRKMLHRVSPARATPDLEFNLWHNLGLIYRDRLQRHEQRDRGVQDGDAAQARRAGRAPDPRRALRDDRAARRGRSASTRSVLAAGPAARRSVPRALQALP